MLQLGGKLTEEQRLEKAVVQIMHKQPAIGGLVMLGKRVVCDKTRTACTDGRDEWYGREFVRGLNDKQLRFLILHEMYHKMYRHLITWRHLWKKCSDTANRAMDYEINIKILDEYKEFVEWIEGGCLNEAYRGWGTAKIFDDIYKKRKEREGGESGDGEGGGGDGGGDGDGEPFDDHDWESAKEMTEEEKRELEREIDEAIRQGNIVAGKTGSGGSRDMEELLQPKVDWREPFREFFMATCAGNDNSTWRKPKRRFIAQNVYLPSTFSETIGELILGIDTSGSTFAPGVLPAFMTETKSICDMLRPERVRILYWDTEICRAEVYEQYELDNMINTTQPEGGGGTDVSCVANYITEHKLDPQAIVLLTDGYLFGGWGNWHHPTLWCVLDNASARPTNGKTIHIKSEDM